MPRPRPPGLRNDRRPADLADLLVSELIGVQSGDIADFSTFWVDRKHNALREVGIVPEQHIRRRPAAGDTQYLELVHAAVDEAIGAVLSVAAAEPALSQCPRPSPE